MNSMKISGHPAQIRRQNKGVSTCDKVKKPIVDDQVSDVSHEAFSAAA